MEARSKPKLTYEDFVCFGTPQETVTQKVVALATGNEIQDVAEIRFDA